MASYYSEQPRRRTERPGHPLVELSLPFLILLILLALVGWWFWPRLRSVHDPNAEARPVVARGDLAEDEKATIQIYKNTAPSVVHITNLVQRQDFFSMDVQEIPQGTGSGFVWDDGGHVVTNFHVVQGGNAFKVLLPNQPRGLDARVVGGYPDKDVAVLWIDVAKGRLHPIPLGTSHDLQVGQKVFAIGNPFGLDNTLTSGIISAVGREIKSVNGSRIKDVIQTDASINPGNSGGPLLDSAGRLIGMNTAIYSTSGVNAGIGFAIPVDEINRIVPQIIQHGKVIRPTLGIQPADDRVMRRLELEGVLVLTVKPGSPAAQAGLRGTRQDATGQIILGDIILAVDGHPIQSKEDLYSIVDEHKIGDTLTLTVLRDEDRRDVKVALGPS